MQRIYSRSIIRKAVLPCLALLLALLTSNSARADFELLSQKSVTIVGEGTQYTEVRFIETPVDSTVTDTVRFVLTGDSTFRLVTTSPMTYRFLITIPVIYSGPAGDTSHAWLVVWDNDHIDTIALTGISTGDGTPLMRADIPSFEDVQVNQQVCRTLTIHNDESYDVTFNGIAMYPLQRWGVTGLTVPKNIPAHDSISFELCYTADSVPGQRVDSIGLYYANNGVQWMKAYGIQISVGTCFESRQYLQFGSLLLGADSTLVWTITNPLDESITVDISDQSGDQSNTYTFTGFPKTIAAHSSADVSVKVEVNALGSGIRTFKLSRTDEACGALTLYASVYGFEQPCFTVVPDSVHLPPILLGDDTTITFAYINTSSDTIEINAYENHLDTSASYSWSGSWPITIPPGDTVYMDLTVTSTDLGSLRDYWSLFATDSSHSTCGVGRAIVTGSVYSNGILPQADIFDDKDGLEVITDIANLYVPFNLRNNGGTSVTITSMALADSTHFVFRKAPVLPATMAADQSKFVSMMFHSLIAGKYTDTLLVTLSDNSVHRVVINGTQQATAAVGPEGDLSVTLEAWPNPVSKLLTLDLKNVSRASISISDMLGRNLSQSTQDFPAQLDVRELGMTPGNYVIRVQGMDVAGKPIVRSIMISVK